jgi:hypothetical protein
MNFMHEIRPCISRIGKRLPDGSIDREHYEIRARRERSAAVHAAFAGMAGWALRQLSALGGNAPARLFRQG